MSAQMVEILILAVIALLVISKLLSVLGTTDEDDPIHKKAGSFFGEPRGLKDVTGTAETVNTKSKVIHLNINKKFSNDAKTNDIVTQIVEKIPDFNHEKFLKGAKKACTMILEALAQNDLESLSELVDKRFIDELSNKTNNYKKVTVEDIAVDFEDTYNFGNSIYIKVALHSKKFKEFWVFTKNINDPSLNWHLSNISL